MTLETKAYIATGFLFFSYFILGVIAHKGYITKWEKKFSRVEKAKQAGHVVKASLIKGGSFSDEDNGRMVYTPHGTYEYIVDGKKYEYRKVFTSSHSTHPPTSMTVYYLDNPKKAFDQDRTSIFNFSWILPWIIGLLVIYIL